MSKNFWKDLPDIGMGLFGAIIMIALAAALLAAGFMWQGYVLTIIWDWFIVTKFHLPSLRIPEAIGLTLVVCFIRQVQYKSNKDDKWDSIVKMFVGPLAVLGLAWTVRLFL